MQTNKTITVYAGVMPTRHSLRMWANRGGYDRAELFKSAKDACDVYGEAVKVEITIIPGVYSREHGTTRLTKPKRVAR